MKTTINVSGIEFDADDVELCKAACLNISAINATEATVLKRMAKGNYEDPGAFLCACITRIPRREKAKEIMRAVAQFYDEQQRAEEQRRKATMVKGILISGAEVDLFNSVGLRIYSLNPLEVMALKGAAAQKLETPMDVLAIAAEELANLDTEWPEVARAAIAAEEHGIAQIKAFRSQQREGK